MTGVISRPRLWLTVAAAPLAWTAQGLLGWWLGARVCADWAVAAARAWNLAIAAGALAIAAAGFGSGLALLRQTRATSMDSANDQLPFIAFGGVFISALVGVGIVWAGAISMLITGCGETR